MSFLCHILQLRRLATSVFRSPRVAIVGSGPAGLCVCSGIIRRFPNCQIDVFDKNSTPFGLVRYGIAPDHPEVKNCINLFEKMFNTNEERISLYCNVSIGEDLTFEELCSGYDVVVLSYGALRQRRLNIPGIAASNVFSGGDFVSWYNAFSGSMKPKLDCTNVIIIGNGNVALDCARIILLAGSEKLSLTDIPSVVLDQLSKSSIKNLSIIGRRGPLDVSFTIKELREQISLFNCSISIKMLSSDVELANSALESLSRPKRRLIELMLKTLEVHRINASRHCQFLFRLTPTEVLADRNGRVRGVKFLDSVTGNYREADCGLLIYSIGYENFVLKGVPKDGNGRIDLMDSMRVRTDFEALVYACGWCAHLPKGVIANTQVESAAVSAQVCSDLEKKGFNRELKGNVKEQLEARGVKYVTWSHWQNVDKEERELGRVHGKEREKILNS